MVSMAARAAGFALTRPTFHRTGTSRCREVPGPEFLSVHEPAGPEVLEEPGYHPAASTPWRDRVVASAPHRERRVFGLRNVIGA
ncbi:MAG TPA: hypothetical protein VFJ07_13830 [Streptosporangiaceae bacterium]|nr:hypothetical protein [Streptosporangiaceae bacterium]